MLCKTTFVFVSFLTGTFKSTKNPSKKHKTVSMCKQSKIKGIIKHQCVGETNVNKIIGITLSILQVD